MDSIHMEDGTLLSNLHNSLDIQIQYDPNENPDKLLCEYQPTDSELYVDREDTHNVDTAEKEENKGGGGWLLWSIF